MNKFLKIFGIVVVLVVLFIIVEKIFFKAGPIDKDVLKFVKGMNETCPSMIDYETRLDKVIAFAGKNLQFNYTLINKVRDSIPVDRLKRYMEPVILDKIRNSGTLRHFLNKKLTWIYSYNDKNGNFIFKIEYSPEQIGY